jgi:hypothetical protein
MPVSSAILSYQIALTVQNKTCSEYLGRMNYYVLEKKYCYESLVNKSP